MFVQAAHGSGKPSSGRTNQHQHSSISFKMCDREGVPIRGPFRSYHCGISKLPHSGYDVWGSRERRIRSFRRSSRSLGCRIQPLHGLTALYPQRAHCLKGPQDLSGDIQQEMHPDYHHQKRSQSLRFNLIIQNFIYLWTTFAHQRWCTEKVKVLSNDSGVTCLFSDTAQRLFRTAMSIGLCFRCTVVYEKTFFLVDRWYMLEFSLHHVMA